MKTGTKKLPKAQIELTVKVDSNDVKAMYAHVLSEAVETTEVPGFRKGHAPKEKVEEKLGVSELYGEVIDHLLQTYYPQALKEHHINPIANPKVEIKEFDLEKDFEFVAIIPTKPDIKIGNFKAELKKLRKEKTTKDKDAKLLPNEVIEAILEKTQMDIADIIVEDETNRMMSGLINQAQSLGITLEDYLKAQNTTSDQLRKNYEKIAEKNVKAEFALAELVKVEKITVEQADIEQTIKASGTDQAEEMLSDPMQKVYIEMILQKNKLINKLIEETETQ